MNTLRGFPKRYDDALPAGGDGWLDNYSKALDATNAGGITILYGGYGTGKTRMAWEIARAHKSKRPNISIGGVGWTVATKKRPMVYTTAMNLFTSIKSTYSSNSEKSEKEVISEYCEAALLVIDEVQVRSETKFEDDKLTTIIDARYMDGMPTILISNYTWERLASTLSPAVIDRFDENGVKLVFDWESFRKKP
jgi:DNA replication protein DnaC